MTSCLASGPGQRAAKTINCIGCCAPLFIFPQINFTRPTRNPPGEAPCLGAGGRGGAGRGWGGGKPNKNDTTAGSKCVKTELSRTHANTHKLVSLLYGSLHCTRAADRTFSNSTFLFFFFFFFNRVTSSSDFTCVKLLFLGSRSYSRLITTKRKRNIKKQKHRKLGGGHERQILSVWT